MAGENGTAAGEIAARVTDAAGVPVVEAFAMITGGPPHHDIAAETDDNGQFLFTDLIPGEYTLLINAEDYAPKEVHTAVGAGEIARLDILLQDS